MRLPVTIGAVLFLIQLLLKGAQSQVFAPITDIIIPTSSKPAVSHSVSPKPTPSHASSSAFTPIIPLPSSTASSILPTLSSILPISSSSAFPSITISSTVSSTTTSPSFVSTSSLSLSSSTSSTTPSTPPPSNNDSEISTPTIVGAVVGGVVGLALLGGVMTWLNRRGGCTSKTNQRKANFEDFGLAERDFPHHRAPASPPVMVSSSGFAGSTVVASPTLPRLNDQGNYYNEGAKHYPEYGNATYYYPQEQSHPGYHPGYYDEHGYYYDEQAGYEHTGPGQVYHPPYSPTHATTPEVYKPHTSAYR